jgi:formylglycine-generating enzyme required for sulfatase activity
LGIVGPATQAKILALAMSTPTPPISQTTPPVTGATPDSFVTQSAFQKQIDSLFNSIALTQRIDHINNVTVSGVSGITDGDIPDSITASNYLLLTGGTLSGDLTVTGNFTVAGAQTLSGAITVPYVAATSTTIDSTFVRLTATYATTTNATSTNLFASALVATNATSTNFFATTASSTNLFTSLFNAGGNTLVVTSAGHVGISTSTPWTKLSVVDTIGSAQFTLAYDQTRYSQLYVDASGDLTLSATGGNVRLPNYNLFVCQGDACPTPIVSISGTGNLQVENRLIAGSIEKTCATGYVWVPGEAKYGTLPGFCTMKYEARNDGSSNAVSTPTGTPWVSISQVTARAQCEALGTGYHLISDQEWMTIADQVAMLPINDLDADAGLQLANGHTDNAPSNSLSTTAGADPIVSGCNLMLNMEDASNAYVASSCEIRGTGSGGSTDNDKGYYGTGQQWSTSGYSAGGANKSQLRTFILQNGAVLWDFPGDVWEWTDAYIYSALASGAASTTSEMPDAGTWSSTNWYDWTQITNFKSLGYIRPKVTTWSAASNGIGRIYLDVDAASDGTNYHAFRRGGDWTDGSSAGVFTLYLNYGPADTNTYIGFRCSR